MTLARFFLLTLIVCFGTMGQTQAQNSDPIVVTTDMERVELSASGYLLEDPSHKLTIDDVRQPEIAKHFIRKGFYAGSRDVSFWFHFRLFNRSDKPITRLLDTGNRVSHELDLYSSDAQGGWMHQSASINRPFAERVVSAASFVFPVVLPPMQTVDLYLRVRTTAPISTEVVPVLWRPDAFARSAHAETLLWIAYVAVCVTVGLLNLMLWVYLRDALFGLYVVALLGVFFSVSYTAGGYGSAGEFLTPNAPLVHQLLMPLSTVLGLSALALFFVRLLSIRRTMPRLFFWMAILLGLSYVGVALRILAIVNAPPALVAFAFTWSPIANLCIALCAVCLLIALIMAAINRTPLASYAAVAYLPYVSYYSWATIANNVFGISVSGPERIWIATFEMLVMSLALAHRFFQEQHQKLEAQSERERLSRLRRFFSPAVADKLVSDQAEDFMKPRRREIVVVFVDLRGYTAFTDTHEADEVMRVLGEFHEAMGEIIMAHGGTLERFAGDGLMIFFNDPIEISDPAQQALAMAVAMQQRFAELQTLWQSRDYTLAMGIGIAQGIATLGAIGFEGRRDYGAIGGVTNLAARLCGEAKGGQILLSEAVAKVLPAQPLRSVGELALKGFAQAQATYEWVAEGGSA